MIPSAEPIMQAAGAEAGCMQAPTADALPAPAALPGGGGGPPDNRGDGTPPHAAGAKCGEAECGEVALGVRRPDQNPSSPPPGVCTDGVCASDASPLAAPASVCRSRPDTAPHSPSSPLLEEGTRSAGISAGGPKLNPPLLLPVPLSSQTPGARDAPTPIVSQSEQLGDGNPIDWRRARAGVCTRTVDSSTAPQVARVWLLISGDGD